jgi:hypothetical protein
MKGRVLAHSHSHPLRPLSAAAWRSTDAALLLFRGRRDTRWREDAGRVAQRPRPPLLTDDAARRE